MNTGIYELACFTYSNEKIGSKCLNSPDYTVEISCIYMYISFKIRDVGIFKAHRDSNL